MIIGIDMGGTHIDGAAIEEGVLVASVKHQVDHTDYFASIWRCLKDLLRHVDKHAVERIHLSTTISTNAIVEGRLSNVALILQSGPGLKWHFERMGDHIIHLSGSVDHRGILVRDLDMRELDETRERLLKSPVEALAVVTKFSTRNPEFEQRIRKYFEGDYDEITVGHTLSGKLNFPRRVRTAYLNAAVSRTFMKFAESMREALLRSSVNAPVYVLKADGGTVDLDGAMLKPVETILSGPAASFMGMRALLDDEQSDRVLIDVGGTTTDMFFLVDGVPVFEPLGIEIDGRRTLVRALFSQSIGIGGDSHVRFEEGILKIGPRREGLPVAFGGESLTPTDALVYLGKLDAQYREKSRNAVEHMAAESGFDAMALAEMIVMRMCDEIQSAIERVLNKLNESPVYTIEELLRDRTIRPQAVEVIGGPAASLSGYLEEAIGLPVLCPEHHEIANAIGAALAKPTIEINMIADTGREMMSIPERGLYQPIDRTFNLREAEEFALSEVREAGKSLGLKKKQLDVEIVESSSFNMVQGYGRRVDRNIRVRAQIKPGLLEKLRKSD
ncbi:MAG TPA: hydantoinase/oxoprolinase family protein [Clostridiaceae bacterium]|nr:hydantoinase/oxoprolinase family protein [Clostridiaceae bacterium]